MQPDFERARAYALDRLEHELPAHLYYHSLRHTRDEVLPAVEWIAQTEGIMGELLMLLKTAALFHDIGYIERRAGHEAIAVRITNDVLPSFGYSAIHIELITNLILATRWPHNPQSPLEEILADADLDSLGRNDFLETSCRLRDELAAIGISINTPDWYRQQLEFLHRHRYFTQAARSRRDPGKRQNIALVRHLLAQLTDHS
jgi:uncharacterized protein